MYLRWWSHVAVVKSSVQRKKGTLRESEPDILASTEMCRVLWDILRMIKIKYDYLRTETD